MSDPLLELLLPQTNLEDVTNNQKNIVSNYTARLSTLSLASLTSTEPDSLDHEAQSSLRSLQALAKRSHKSIDASTESLSRLQTTLPRVALSSAQLQSSLPTLENGSMKFSQKYCKPSENDFLERRRNAILLGENVEKISDILEMPSLLISTIAASASSSASTGPATSATANYASALDLYAHIKRMQRLYPESNLIKTISSQAESAMRSMTTNLILSLRSQSLKLAGAMRLVGLLRRVAPELDESLQTSRQAWSHTSSEGSLGALFLVCRLANLTSMLEALEPLQDLADQETATRQRNRERRFRDDRNAWAAGQQTERYLKRYVEVFREQCFAIISMYKSIFPGSLPDPITERDSTSQQSPSVGSRQRSFSRQHDSKQDQLPEDPIQNIPSSLSTFIFQLVDKLIDTLRDYMPNVQERSSRESLLTQVLYCSSSLGRLGGDFGMVLALLEEELEEESNADENGAPKNDKTYEWIEVMKRHRTQASRLELLASGVGASKSIGASTKAIASPN